MHAISLDPLKQLEKGRTKNLIAVSELRNLRVSYGSFPRYHGKYVAEWDWSSQHLTPGSGFSPVFLLPWIQGQDWGRDWRGWRWGSRYDTSEICIPSASSTIVSNTKEAWEWQRHFPDWHNEFSIGAYIMDLHRKTTVFLSETVYVVSSFIACSLCAKGKVKILQLKKKNLMRIQRWNSNNNEICVKLI